MNSTPRDPRSSSYIPTLDGWRAIAISSVMVCHSLHFYGSADLVPPHWRLFNDILARLGTFGVALFFAISGYLICTLLLVEREKTGVISLRSFYIRRAFRIIPPAFVYLGVLALLAAWGLIQLQRGELASAALFYSNYWTSKSWFTTHFWSLSLEEHFYLLWPSLLGFLGPIWAAGCALAVVVVTPIARPFAIAGLSGNDLAQALEKTPMRLESFMIACLIAILLRNRRVRERCATFFRMHVWFLLCLMLGATILLATRLERLHIDGRSIESLLLAAIVAVTTLRPLDWVGRILELAPLRFVGRISYSIYLWQQLIMQPVNEWSVAGNILPMFVKIGIVIGLALLSYQYIEQPFMRWGRRLAAQKQLPATTPRLASLNHDGSSRVERLQVESPCAPEQNG